MEFQFDISFANGCRCGVATIYAENKNAARKKFLALNRDLKPVDLITLAQNRAARRKIVRKKL